MIIERESTIDAPIDRVWDRVVSPEGINDELRPWLTMSLPRGAESFTVDTVPVGKPLGRAWLRLFGVLPFDYDALTIAELDRGRRFHEKSTMLSMRRWEHERTLTACDDGRTRIRDRITFEPRIPMAWMAPVIGRVLHALFGHRHRRLQRHFD
ncbi:hypothetical protein [Rhodococcus tibetensis]|uniref:Ligand-binding SRPBCC domain-containing protein n=1 Tax=Rhodococcus tibetensis TaxID=2965064 RepID=A0ABT1Q643_9NOCA|nr:hypothetical protein [Rhodococcus sp. FXJ9.536]MCQ4117731.1 hypothetical protein [Rhodococcus sp. FXJ9.536]